MDIFCSQNMDQDLVVVSVENRIRLELPADVKTGARKANEVPQSRSRSISAAQCRLANLNEAITHLWVALLQITCVSPFKVLETYLDILGIFLSYTGLCYGSYSAFISQSARLHNSFT